MNLLDGSRRVPQNFIQEGLASKGGKRKGGKTQAEYWHSARMKPKASPNVGDREREAGLARVGVRRAFEGRFFLMRCADTAGAMMEDTLSTSPPTGSILGASWLIVEEHDYKQQLPAEGQLLIPGSPLRSNLAASISEAPVDVEAEPATTSLNESDVAFFGAAAAPPTASLSQYEAAGDSIRHQASPSASTTSEEAHVPRYAPRLRNRDSKESFPRRCQARALARRRQIRTAGVVGGRGVPLGGDVERRNCLFGPVVLCRAVLNG